MTSNKQAQQKPEVVIQVDRDIDANHISAVLEALGYAVLRHLGEGDAPQRLAWAIDRLVLRHGLTGRERDVLVGVLDGLDNDGLAKALKISRATVKWHLHNVFAKVGVGTREALLRLALQLGGHDRSLVDDEGDDPYRAGPEDVTVRL